MALVDVFYINLDSAVDRRQTIEQSIIDSGFSDQWRFQRFPAITANAPEVVSSPGSADPRLKGNWLSHVGCAKAAKAAGLTTHILIAEDDTIFCSETEKHLSKLLSTASPESWDLLYLDIALSNAVDMPWFFKLRRDCFRKEEVQLISMLNFPRAYAGAGGYIINNASLDRFIALGEAMEMNCPFDIYLRHVVSHGFLKGWLTFPFLTSVAECADTSQVQDESDHLAQDTCLNAFRRLTWIGAGPPSDAKAEDGSGMNADVKDLMAVLGRLLTVQLDWHY